MGNDLKQEFVDDKFKSFYEFEDFNPQKVGSDIEENLPLINILMIQY